ncbi:MAG: ABC transporter permease [Nitrososphaerota archaeon]|nr:ABC transporter permease [Nitrososphaerota archaeon]
MRLENAWLVFSKDWNEIRHSRQLITPVILMPLVMVVILPLVAIQIPLSMSSQTSFQSSGAIIELPFEISSLTAGMTNVQAFVYTMSTVFFAPFTMLVPLIVASIISSDSFAGEKERKTIEALLATPISDSEMLFGKILASFIPTMLSTGIAFFAYATITDYLDYPLFGHLILPNLTWMLIILGLAPAFAIAATGLTVIISVRVSGTREAQQLSGLLVIPIIGVMFAQTSGVMILGTTSLVVLILIMCVVDYVIIRAGTRLFNREKILTKM